MRRVAAQQRVDDFADVLVDREPVAILNLDQHVERRRRLALEHGLARAAAARFLIGERHGGDAAHQVGEGRVHQQVLERLAVRGADQLHAALGDRARGQRFGLGADLVDHDDLRHVVLDRLDHHVVLQRWDRRPACAARGRCRRCGTSPSPAISFDVSTMTTRLRSSLKTRAHSRSIVVLPTPGRPSKQIDLPLRITSRMMSIVPYTARPTRHVSPTMSPLRLRIALMRCSVCSIPARLSPPNGERCETTAAMIFVRHGVIGQEDEIVFETRFRPAT